MQETGEERTLSSLKVGQSGIVHTVSAKGDMRRRLQDLGLVHGTRVDCVGISPLGDPKAFRIRGAVIALRRTDAATVRLFGQTVLCTL